MKISDVIFQYPAGSNRTGICRVRIFVAAARGAVALLTDLGEKNTYSSVTNSVERICDSLIEKGLVPENSRFIEHYEENDFRGATFDLVIRDSFGNASWQTLAQEKVEVLLGCEAAELKVPTVENERLLCEIERARNQIDPFIDSPWPESADVINRRADIESKMLRKQSLVELVDAGATEQDLQRLLKTDLSIFAEMYAHPPEEYICFSEFPVADGAVDFALFSGRSRMDVVLIEVKGADFFLMNQGHYDKFSSKIEVAVDQVRNRLGFVYRNFELFRKGVHKIRGRVEAGKLMHNSLIGPYGNLQVDKNKDINIRCVVIGGRSRNDFEESRKRHDYERTFSPSVKIESWDSWLMKVRRV